MEVSYAASNDGDNRGRGRGRGKTVEKTGARVRTMWS